MSNHVDSVHPQPNWWEYRSELYVRRTSLEKEIIVWLEDPAPLHPIRFITGGPGVGKSWLLTHMFDEIRERRSRDSLPCFVLNLDARTLLKPDTHKDIERIKLTVIDEAKKCCLGASYPKDTAPPLDAIVKSIRQRLCDQCPSMKFLVLVDNCDDLASQEDFDDLQDRLLVPFFNVDANDCFRMIIAQRYYKLVPELKLRSSPLLVNVFNDPRSDSEEQKNRFFSQSSVAPPTDLTTLLPANCEYQWNHPCINAFLWSYYAKEETITSKTLVDCYLFLVNRPPVVLENYKGRHSAAVDDLTELMQLAHELPDQWDTRQFTLKTRRLLDSTYLEQGIVRHLEKSRYTFADGLRELLRDLATMREMEATS